MRQFGIVCVTFVFIMTVVSGIAPAKSQEPVAFQWAAPLNPGQMPQNQTLLPPIHIMPTLPLPETLIPGTLFFNIQDFSDGYRILYATLDARLYAYNISYQYGIQPISPNGHYGIYTVPTGAIEVITCGILDLLTNVTVDRFDTTGACDKSSLFWSPDSSKILFQFRDENGRPGLGIRQNGQTTIIQPAPAAGVDLGGQPLVESREYFATGWLNNNIVAFDIGLSGTLSEELFTALDDPTVGQPARNLSMESVGKRLMLVLPAQPVDILSRSYGLTDLVNEASFSLAPEGHIARLAAVSPDDSKVVYWAETQTLLGTTHPLRLVVYDPDSDQHIPLLQFDGPVGDALATRPGELVWNPEGIYFYISQQPGAVSPLQSGTYRIQPDGSTLEFVTKELLWDSLAP